MLADRLWSVVVATYTCGMVLVAQDSTGLQPGSIAPFHGVQIQVIPHSGVPPQKQDPFAHLFARHQDFKAQDLGKQPEALSPKEAGAPCGGHIRILRIDPNHDPRIRVELPKQDETDSKIRRIIPPCGK